MPAPHPRLATWALLGALAASPATAGSLAWSPDPADDPCEIITAPADPSDEGWRQWRAAMCGDVTLADLLPPVRRLGGIAVANDAEAFDLLARAWLPHELKPVAPIPLPASGWLMLAALAALMWRMKK